MSVPIIKRTPGVFGDQVGFREFLLEVAELEVNTIAICCDHSYHYI